MTIQVRKENIMKFWDDKVDNGIDAMFDWDHDGELDQTEKMNELEWMTMIWKMKISMMRMILMTTFDYLFNRYIMKTQ